MTSPPPHDILNMLLGAQNMLLPFLPALLKYSRGGGENFSSQSIKKCFDLNKPDLHYQSLSFLFFNHGGPFTSKLQIWKRINVFNSLTTALTIQSSEFISKFILEITPRRVLSVSVNSLIRQEKLQEKWQCFENHSFLFSRSY